MVRSICYDNEINLGNTGFFVDLNQWAVSMSVVHPVATTKMVECDAAFHPTEFYCAEVGTQHVTMFCIPGAPRQPPQ